LTAERLLELSRGPKEGIVNTLLSLHPPKAAAAEIKSTDATKSSVFQLLDSLFQASTECFAKAFTNGLDILRSGGADEAVCPHGAHYCLLPIAKTESVIDAINVTTLFKHTPNVNVFDWWCGGKSLVVAACSAVNVKLGPRAGALYLDDAKEMPVVSVPALAIEQCPSFAMSDSAILVGEGLGVERKPHPISGSDLCFLAHDRLKSAAHKRCPGRDPDLIKELRTENSMRHEEENVLREKDSSWLRNYSPQRNLLMLLVTAHLRNRKLAFDFLQKARVLEVAQQKHDPAGLWCLRMTEFGQIKLQSCAGLVLDIDVT
jgi:hypothetical protein